MAIPIIIEARDPDREVMGIAVAEEGQEGRDVDLVFAQVEGVDAHDWSPETGDDAAGEDDGEGPDDAGEVVVDVKLDFAEGGVAVEGRFGEGVDG